MNEVPTTAVVGASLFSILEIVYSSHEYFAHAGSRETLFRNDGDNKNDFNKQFIGKFKTNFQIAKIDNMEGTTAFKLLVVKR